MVQPAGNQDQDGEGTVDPPPANNTPKATETPAAPVEKPDFYRGFAIVAGVVAVVALIGALAVLHLRDGHIGLSEDAWDKLSGLGQLAVRLTVPMTALGILLVLAGAWMAIVEWRGGFAKKAKDPVAKGEAAGLPEVIAAVGKLRGAALVAVVGALLLLGGAWVASSAAKPPPEPTPSATAGS